MRSLPRLTALGLTVAALGAAALVAPTASVAAPANYRRGPAPTAESVTATTGPFAISTVGLTDGQTPASFGGATVSYPTSAARGRFGVVAMVPGFTETRSAVDWLRPRLASQGFVVIAFDTRSIFDFPDARGQELLDALDFVVGLPQVAAVVDRTRTAVVGHSMGGGATLEASRARPGVKAAVGLAPWDVNRDWSQVTTPSLEIGAQNDSIAPVDVHAVPFYDSLPASSDKGYLEIAGADHFVTNNPTPLVQTMTLAWLKRYVDGDTRYTRFLCPGPGGQSTVSAYRTTAC